MSKEFITEEVLAFVATGIGGLCGGFLLGRGMRRSSESNAISKAEAAIATKAEATPSMPLDTPATPLPHTQSTESSGEFLQLMLGIVDAVDEIELMKSRASAAEQVSQSAIQERLRDLIELSGGELICETSWNSAVQRAVKVEPAESGQIEVRFLQTRSTGLKHAGRIIRKQEVIISQPKP